MSFKQANDKQIEAILKLITDHKTLQALLPEDYWTEGNQQGEAATERVRSA
jgi:hypothetical protein